MFEKYRITEGLILISIGCLLLAKNFGYIPELDLWKLWPLILVAFGVRQIFKKSDRD